MGTTKTYKLILLFLLPIETLGQIGNGGIHPYLDIRSFMSLKVDVGKPGLDYTFDSDKTYNSGIVNSKAFDVKIKSNQNWRLTVSSQTAFFSNVSSGSFSNVPSKVLSIKADKSNTFLPVQLNPVEIANGKRGSDNKSGNSFDLDLKADPGLNYDGGIYALTIVFSLSPD